MTPKEKYIRKVYFLTQKQIDKVQRKATRYSISPSLILREVVNNMKL